MQISCVTKNLEGPSSSIMRLFHHFFWIGFKSICISLVWPQSITLYYYKLLQNYFPFFQNLNLNNQTTLRRWQYNKSILLDRRWRVLTSKCFNAQESGFFSQEASSFRIISWQILICWQTFVAWPKFWLKNGIVSQQSFHHQHKIFNQQLNAPCQKK